MYSLYRQSLPVLPQAYMCRLKENLIVQKDLPTSLVSDFIVKIISKLYHAYVRNTTITRYKWRKA